MQLFVTDIKKTGSIHKEVSINPLTLMGPPNDVVAFDSPILAKIDAQMTDEEIYIKGQVHTTVALHCARCLDDFNKRFQGEFSLSLTPDHEKIDLSEQIRETVLIEIPMKALCQESCKGICSYCGTNKNKHSCECPAQSEEQSISPLKNFPFPS